MSTTAKPNILGYLVTEDGYPMRMNSDGLLHENGKNSTLFSDRMAAKAAIRRTAKNNENLDTQLEIHPVYPE
jgi:hypothetical protein